jgi:hypothetical protein
MKDKQAHNAHPLHQENKNLQSNTFVIMVHATQANHYLGCCKGAEFSALQTQCSGHSGLATQQINSTGTY